MKKAAVKEHKRPLSTSDKIFNVFSLTFSSAVVNASFINLLAEIIHSCKSIPANLTLAKLSSSLNNLQRKAALV